MPKEWVAGEEESFVCSISALQEQIHALAACGRAANVRLNVRELVAPLLFSARKPVSEKVLSAMMGDVVAAQRHIALLAEKLSLLAAELLQGGGAIGCA